MSGARVQRRCRTPRAFTLLEVIVAIGIVVILLAILTPALSGARHSSQVLANAATLRSVAQVIEVYADAWHDVYPMADTKPAYRPSYLPDVPDDDPSWGLPWYAAVIDAGLMSPSDAFSADAFNVRNVSLSITLMHEPRVFRFGSVAAFEERIVSAIRRSSVAHPGRKGTMTLITVDGSPILSSNDYEMAWCCVSDPPGGVAFADASVDIVSRSKLPEPPHPPVGDIGMVVRSTWNGVEGTDR